MMMKKGIIKNLLVTIVLLAMVGCAKSRISTLGQNGEELNVFNIGSEISGKRFIVETAAQLLPQADNLQLASSTEVDRVKIAKVHASNKIAMLFEGLTIEGQANSKYEFVLEIDEHNLTAYKIVPADSADSLSLQESQLALKNSAKEQKIPVFQYAVEKYGVLTRKKNDIGENTHVLRFDETVKSEATHIEIANQVFERDEIAMDFDLAKRVLRKEGVHGRNFTKVELQKLMNITVVGNQDKTYYTELAANEMQLFEYVDANSLTEKEKELLENSKGMIEACSAEQVNLSTPKLAEGDCYIALRFTVPVSYVALEREYEDQSGAYLGHQILAKLQAGQQSDLIQLAEVPQPIQINPSEELVNLDFRNTLDVAGMSDKEFLLRRTLEDSPNSFNYTFAGSAGDLEIVKFRFTKDEVQVVRAEPLTPQNSDIGGNTSIDEEVLMSFAADYKKKQSTDDHGNELARPNFVKAQHDEKGAMAYVNWAQNQVPNVASPLNYWGGLSRACFRSALSKEASAIDHRLDKGKEAMLNFSLTTRYAGNVARGCTDDVFAGYFDKIESIYTFKERVSLKFYRNIDEKIDEERLLAMPYQAQKKLGFGMFTYKKKTPNELGEIDRLESEEALPAIFDVRKGKKIEYVLAGLPRAVDGKELTKKQKMLREAIIKSTKEVIADLNKGMKEALKGSEHASGGDVITLVIEGENEGQDDVGTLGDLDRNFIYYVKKPTDVGIIGLGGSHSNPRSGKVESASVFLYGGNMLRSVQGLRRRARAMDQYKEMTKVAVEELPDAPVETEDRDEALDSLAEGASSAVEDGEVVAEAEAALDAPDSIVMPKLKNLQNRLSSLSTTQNVKLNELLSNVDKRKMKFLAHDLKDHFHGGQNFSAETLKSLPVKMPPKLMQLREAFDVAKAYNSELPVGLQKSAWGNPSKLQRIFSSHNSPAKYSALIENMENADYCVKSFDEVAASIAGVKLDYNKEGFEADLELLIAMWKPTLAHEIGHNLGLRHNFHGSFDKTNWVADKADSSERDYSSVMDYLTTDHETYDGLGPYDVAALRAAYTGRLELIEEAKAAVSGGELNLGPVSLPVEDGNYVKVDEIKKLLGLDHWKNLTQATANMLPIKKYLYCSDEDVSLLPTCNRFDRGTTPVEIVRTAAEDYRAFYSLVNFPNGRLYFGERGVTGGYVGRLFGRFIPIRQMLEETFYQLSTVGGDSFQPFLEAAVEGLFFFHEIIRTPSAPGFLPIAERFAPVTREVVDEESGKHLSKTYMIERKWNESLVQDIDEGRLALIGNEYDKVVAMILLTERNMGFARYESASLRIAFPDLENFLWAELPPTRRPTLGLLREILENNIAAVGATPDGSIQLDSSFQVQSNELIRVYAMLSSIANLDVGTDAGFNHSLQFRIVNSSIPNVPEETPSMTRPESQLDRRFWSTEESQIGRHLTDLGSSLEMIANDREELTADFQKWTELVLAADPEAEENPDLDAQTELITQKLTERYPESVGLRDMTELGGLMVNVINTAAQVEQMSEVLPPEQVQMIMYEVGNQLNQLAKDNPVAGVALGSLDAEALGVATLDQLKTDRVLDGQRGILFSNVESLSSVFLDLHPNYHVD